MKINRLKIPLAVICLMSLIFVAIAAVSCTAQTGAQTFGEITGTISDATGAVVAKAEVKVTNNNTGVSYSTIASQTGGFTVIDLPVGVYSVRATAQGFGTTTNPLVKVSIGFTSTVNLVLKIQAVTEAMTVSTDTTEAQVDTADGNLSTLLSNKDIMDLPLQDRNSANLVLLAPGSAVSTTYLGGFTINGSRERNNSFLVDGSDNNDSFGTTPNGGLATPNIDATSELRVVTGGYDAQYGHSAGSTVLVATKSGTNVFHGGAYYYYRSSKWEASPYFSTAGPAPLQHREFGVNIGGPIMRNRTFFFVNYEQHKDVDGASNLRYVPNPNALSGIITGTSYGTINLSTNQPVGQNLLQSQVMKGISALYPAGNDHKEDFYPGFIDAYRFNYGDPSSLKSVTTRVDHRFSDKYSLSASYNIKNGDSQGTPTFPLWKDGLGEPYRNQVLSLSLISNFSTRSINDLHTTLNRTSPRFEGVGTGEVSGYLPTAVQGAFQAAGISVSPTFSGESLNEQMIDFDSGPYTSVSSYKSDYRATGTYSVADNFTRVLGNHTLVFGGQYDWIYENTANNFNYSEELGMNYPGTESQSIVNDNNGNPISPYDTSGGGSYIDQAASWYWGLVGNQYENQFFNKAGTRTPTDERGFRMRSGGLFLQDTWKVRSNLILSYGLRWQANGVPWDIHGNLSNLLQNPNGTMPSGGYVFQVVGKNSGGHQNLYANDWRDYGPRFGFAWDPYRNGKTAVRGGYGIFYDRAYGNLYGNARANPPFQDTSSIYPTLQTIDTLSRPATLTPSSAVNQDYTYQEPTLFPLPGNNPFQSVMRMPLEQHFSLGVQQQLAPGFLLDLSYVGSNGQHEFTLLDADQTSVTRANALTGSSNAISTNTFTNWDNGVLSHAFYLPYLQATTARSDYNSLQTKITERLASKSYGNAFIQGSYTWSHSIDDGTDPIAAASGEASFPMDSSGYVGGPKAEKGNSGFDIRQIAIIDFTYELPPLFKSGWQDRAFGHFELSGIFSEHTGNAYSIFDTVDSAGTGQSQRASWASSTNPALSPASRTSNDPVVGPSMTRFGHSVPVGDTFDEVNGVFVGGSGIGSQGTVGRNYFHGPHWENFDVSVLKRIPIKEGVFFRVEASAFNVFNHPVMGLPNATIDQANFGESTSQANSPRSLQIAGRLEF